MSLFSRIKSLAIILCSENVSTQIYGLNEVSVSHNFHPQIVVLVALVRLHISYLACRLFEE